MTVCAVRLKSMPGTERLLLEYVQRGLAQGLLAVEGGDGNGSGNIAGYLESDGGRGGENNAMIVRHDTIGSSASGITGGELTIFGAPSNGSGGNNVNYGATVNNNINGSNIMGMNNVNAPFSGHSYSHSDADRPTHVADCKYIDALLQMPCYLNLNAFGLFTSSRDVSVSLAALEAVRVYGTLGEGYFIPHDCDGMPVIKGDDRGGKKSKRNNNGPRVNPASTALLVLNEGPTPRTTILASQHYGWQTFAIDPSLSEEWDGYHNDIPNFTGYSGTISDFMDSADGEGVYVSAPAKTKTTYLQHASKCKHSAVYSGLALFVCFLYFCMSNSHTWRVVSLEFRANGCSHQTCRHSYPRYRAQYLARFRQVGTGQREKRI